MAKYYLFLDTEEELSTFRKEFDRVRESMDSGKTPVFSELRSARTNIVENAPYRLIQAVLMVVSTVAISKLNMSELLSVAVVLVVNGACSDVANFIFVILKHRLRERLLNRMGLEPSERNIAVLESLEYQSV